jgi:hypothetical protein
MTNRNRPGRANRTALCTLGVVVLAAGAFTLLTTFGLLPTPGFGPHRRLITSSAPPLSWAPYVIVVVAILLGLGCLWFLAAQARRHPKTQSWRLAGDRDRGSTRLHADVAAEPLSLEIEDYPGVRAAAAWLSGQPNQPALLLRVRTDHEANIIELRQRIHTEALPRLAQALELGELPTTTLVEPTTATTRAR